MATVETAAGTYEPRPAATEEAEQGVTPLELFFDLVFVFAITQVTALIASRFAGATCAPSTATDR